MSSVRPPTYINQKAPSSEPILLEVHTPVTSVAIQHSLNQENLNGLIRKLNRKGLTDSNNIGPNCLKYEYNDIMWNLDDDSDYAIFIWRQQQLQQASSTPINPVLHLRHPSIPLPTPPEYRNPAFYMFRPNRAVSPATNGTGGHLGSSASRAPSMKSKKSKLQGQSNSDLPAYKKTFIDFQSSNGVRTVRGSVGPIDNVRMLLKNGYRHVYMSRKFAVQHGFVPADAEPGSYGYSGLVNIGTWPLTVGYTTTQHPVYLAEETHFDVILGRSFMEKRGIKTDPLDMTHVECLDTGEKLECEVVIIRDGKGEIITVT